MMRFLFIMAIVILFIGLNAGYSSNIRFWFGDKASFQNVPIYVSLFVAYMLGAFSVIPFALNRTISRLKKRKKKEKAEKESVDNTSAD